MFAGFRHAFGKGADGRAPIHAAPLMGSPGVVVLELVIEHRLHLLDSFKPGAPSLDPVTCPPETFPNFGRVCFSRGRTNETQQVQR